MGSAPSDGIEVTENGVRLQRFQYSSVNYFTLPTAGIAHTYSCDPRASTVAWKHNLMRKDRTPVIVNFCTRTPYRGRFAPQGIGVPKGAVRPSGVLQT